MQLNVADVASLVSPSVQVELKQVSISVVVITYIKLIRTREALHTGRVDRSRQEMTVLIAIPLQMPPMSK